MAIQRAQETNVECITRLMTFSQQGALVQAFVIEALAQLRRCDQEHACREDQLRADLQVGWSAIAQVAEHHRVRIFDSDHD